jgi:hypothetical protein
VLLIALELQYTEADILEKLQKLKNKDKDDKKETPAPAPSPKTIIITKKEYVPQPKEKCGYKHEGYGHGGYGHGGYGHGGY